MQHGAPALPQDRAQARTGSAHGDGRRMEVDFLHLNGDVAAATVQVALNRGQEVGWYSAMHAAGATPCLRDNAYETQLC